MTDVEVYRGPASELVGWAQAGEAAYQLAQKISATQFAPEQFRGKPAEAAVAIIAGAEVGLSPLQALQSTYVIGGRPAYYARTMVALAQRQGHEVWTEKETPASVTVCGRRAGSDQIEQVTVTLEQARKAGWTRNKQYDSNPVDMLWARAASKVCRRIAADALLGIPYSVEELQDGDAQEAKPRRVSRKPAEPDAPAIEAPVGADRDDVGRGGPPTDVPPPPPEQLPDPSDGDDPWTGVES
jgi:hypothetical protein